MQKLKMLISMMVNAVLLALLFIILTLLLVVVNILLLLNAVLVAPFSRRLFRIFAADIVTSWLVVGKFYMEHVLKIHYTIHADAKLQEVEKGILIANHQSMIDILVMNQLAVQAGRYRERNWLAKNTFKYVPLLGWGAYLTGSTVYLRRDWTRDKGRLLESFARLLSSDHSFWLMFCPEGTRLTAKRLAASQAINRQQQRPLFTRVLSPRPKGFIAAVSALRPVISAVIDVTICYSHRPPLFRHILRGDRLSIDVHVKIVPVADLPPDEEGLRGLLFDLFKEKDQLLKDQLLSVLPF